MTNTYCTCMCSSEYFTTYMRVNILHYLLFPFSFNKFLINKKDEEEISGLLDVTGLLMLGLRSNYFFFLRRLVPNYLINIYYFFFSFSFFEGKYLLFLVVCISVKTLFFYFGLVSDQVSGFIFF